MRKCKDCAHAIPDTDMQAYECGIDHGLRYGYQGCSREEASEEGPAERRENMESINWTLRPSNGDMRKIAYLGVAFLAQDLQNSMPGGMDAADPKTWAVAELLMLRLIRHNDFMDYISGLYGAGARLAPDRDIRELADKLGDIYDGMIDG